MKAMIMSAGRGRRLRPLTDTQPKPLVRVQDKPLIVYHLEALQKAGVQEVVINLGHLGEKIQSYLGTGHAFGLEITYTHETTLLEVAGGIANALPVLGRAPFMVVNADIWTDFDFKTLMNKTVSQGHLVLVPNPIDHSGDFTLTAQRIAMPVSGRPTYTFAGIAVYHPCLFHQVKGAQPMKPILAQAIAQSQLTGQLYQGQWSDVGTPDRLNTLQKLLSSSTVKSN